MSEKTTERSAPVARTWQPIETVPWDRYVLLCDKNAPRWDGNMEVGKWFGGEEDYACFYSPGGPNGGLEIGDVSMGHYGDFTNWMDLPDDPEGQSETTDSWPPIRRHLDVRQKTTVPWPIKWKRDYNELADLLDTFLEHHPRSHPKIRDALEHLRDCLRLDVMGALDLEDHTDAK